MGALREPWSHWIQKSIYLRVMIVAPRCSWVTLHSSIDFDSYFIWVVVSNIFSVHPTFREDSQFDYNIFQMGWFNHQLVMFGRLDEGGDEPFKDKYFFKTPPFMFAQRDVPTLHPATNSRPQGPNGPPAFPFWVPAWFFWKCSTTVDGSELGRSPVEVWQCQWYLKEDYFSLPKGHQKETWDLTSVFLSHFWTSWTSRNIAISWNRDTLNSPCFCQTIVVIGFLGPKSEKIRLNFPRNLHRIESRWRNSQKVD